MSETCEKCGWWKKICHCGGWSQNKFYEFKPMWYTDISETPVYVTSKNQLRNECKKHGVTAARLM